LTPSTQRSAMYVSYAARSALGSEPHSLSMHVMLIEKQNEESICTSRSSARQSSAQSGAGTSVVWKFPSRAVVRASEVKGPSRLSIAMCSPTDFSPTDFSPRETDEEKAPGAVRCDAPAAQPATATTAATTFTHVDRFLEAVTSPSRRGVSSFADAEPDVIVQGGNVGFADARQGSLCECRRCGAARRGSRVTELRTHSVISEGGVLIYNLGIWDESGTQWNGKSSRVKKSSTTTAHSKSTTSFTPPRSRRGASPKHW
jgi:hypothetical protein